MPKTNVPQRQTTREGGLVRSLFTNLDKVKRFAPIPLLMIGLLATAALRFDGELVAEELSLNVVSMPIEVFGFDGHVVDVSVDVSNSAGVDSMYIVGHSLGYHNSPGLWDGSIGRDEKASYRVNGGAWRNISNANANVRFPENAYMGIGGAYHTVRLTVPVSTIVSGANTVEFRFNGTEGVSAGFRILELDMLGPGGVSRIGNTTFIQDDPESWGAPIGYESPSDAAAGEQLWTQRNLLISSPLPGSQVIVASCSDCHAYSGFDLKYFNYSNESIVERSKFHGLTEEEGSQIAAFIRQLELDRTDGRETSPYARPWNPPYQPGPGLTVRGEEDWAAGAGIGSILDSDDDLPAYLFPDVAGNVPNANPSREDMRRAMHVGSYTGSDEDAWGNRLDFQNIPIAIQFPDWNNWLPDIHPFDAFGFQDFTSSELWQYHNELYDRLDTPSERDSEIDEFRSWITTTSNGSTGINEAFSRFDLTIDQFTPDVSLDINYSNDPSGYHLARFSFVAWEAVKTWEVVNDYKLQDLSDELWGGLVTPSPWQDAGNPLRLVGSRSSDERPYFWPGPNSLVFNLAPHKNVDNSVGTSFPSEGPYGPAGTELLEQYFSTAWYDLQLVISRGIAGMQATNGSRPIDWSYQVALLSNLEDTSGISNWWRRLRTKTFATQTHNNYWMMRTTGAGGMGCHCAQHPKESSFFKVFGVNTSPDGVVWHGMDTDNEPLARAAAEEFLSELFEFRRSVPLDEWPRTDDQFQPASYTPTSYPGSSYYFENTEWANNAYRLLPILDAWGTRESLVNDIAQWGEDMWPNGNWEQWFSNGGDAPEVTITAPADGQIFSAPATFEISALVVQDESPIDRVEFYSNGDLIGTDSNAPYTASLTELGVGSYELVATAIDSEGEEGMSIPVTVSVALGNPPTVVLTEPLIGQVFVAPATIEFTAQASSSGRTITRVEFYAGQVLIGEDQSPPYTALWSAVESGTYVLSAKAFDSVGEEATSSPVPVTVVDETGENRQFIPLLPGWNLASTHIEPDAPAMPQVFADILQYVVMVRDGEGNAFIPESEINDIGTWKVDEGYQIFVTDAVTLQLVGTPQEPETSPISLGEGWNQTAYLRNTAMPIDQALESVSDQIVVVKDAFGRIYIPELDINQIGDMLPGQGYKIYASEDCTLLYPQNGEGVRSHTALAVKNERVPSRLDRQRHIASPISVSLPAPTIFVSGGQTSGSSATLVLVAPNGLEGYIIGLRTPDGEIVGYDVVRNGQAIVLIVGEDAPNPEQTDGATQGEELEIFVQGVDGREIPNIGLGGIMDLLSGIETQTALAYDDDGLWLSSLETESNDGDGQPLDGFQLEAMNYPNPFSGSTTILYTLNRPAYVDLQVIDMLGRQVATVVAADREPGTYRASFDASQLSSGLYIYRVQADEQMATGRMVVSR